MYFSSTFKKKKADFIWLYRRTRGEQCTLPSKAYSAVFHKILTQKLLMFRLEKQTVRWTKTYLNIWVPRWWLVSQSLAGGQGQAVRPTGQYWGQSCSTSSLPTQRMGQWVSSAVCWWHSAARTAGHAAAMQSTATSWQPRGGKAQTPAPQQEQPHATDWRTEWQKRTCKSWWPPWWTWANMPCSKGKQFSGCNRESTASTLRQKILLFIQHSWGHIRRSGLPTTRDMSTLDEV